ncbi:hypothetical protein [Sporosarcina jiandibaonis]|uniref:hypothetical protein n=1 Tax=Sporosarcina jiandibaonis TaxID=2715535 RepID=UPI001554AB23|nr:hypothetical protein [Sporosarcina jiandibaonis]
MQNGDVNEMSMWQNHEQRITTIEVNMANLKGEFLEVKEMIGSGNKKAEEKLDAIDKTLMNEFFAKKRVTHETKSKIYLKVAGGLLGGGGLIYAAYDIIVNKIILGG